MRIRRRFSFRRVNCSGRGLASACFRALRRRRCRRPAGIRRPISICGRRPPSPGRPSRRRPPSRPTRPNRRIRRGDALFASHKHSDALVHYIKAAEQSPELADAWFRQGFAQAADGEYALAAKSLRHAMELNPNWAGSSFRLAAMYGTDVMSKRSRMTALYAAAHKDPADADLQFLIGAHLYFDGKADRAVQYFQRADKLQGK